MPRFSRFAHVLPLLTFVLMSLLFASACGDTQDNTPGQSSGDPYLVTVHYNDQQSEIDVSLLPTVSFEGADMVELSELVAAAGIAAPYDDYVFDFAAADGYRPADKDDCVPLIPLAGAEIAKGYISVGEQRLYWDSDGFPGCMSIKDFAHLYVALDGGELPEEYKVAVVHYADDEDVVVDGMATETVDGVDAVPVSAILAAAGIDAPYDDYFFDFVAADGYRPGVKENCADAVPVDGENIASAYIELTENRLIWAESAGMPGCLSLKDLAEIIVTDATPPAFSVTVTYGENSWPVDINTLDVDIVDGAPLVALPDVIAATEISAELAALAFDFASGDYFPHDKTGCTELLPMSASVFEQGFISPERWRLIWPEEMDAPSCLRLKEITDIIVTDAE